MNSGSFCVNGKLVFSLPVAGATPRRYNPCHFLVDIFQCIFDIVNCRITMQNVKTTQNILSYLVTQLGKREQELIVLVFFGWHRIF